ncbi:MAG: flippase-like domain-containing protein [Acidobacteriia bacterium]|nr:flippase-like domain-containing protein [Terriglobia bacterium]
MTKKRIIVSAILIALLVGLVYLQFREWKRFNWHVFLERTQDANAFYLATAVALIYLDYLLRAIRWKLFLKPVCEVSWRRLLGPTMIGFTGIALLGRPGEFVRPYVIARKENLPISSQMAVWAVERIFDTGAFAILVALDLVFAGSLKSLQHYQAFRNAGVILLVVVLAVSLFMVLLYRKTEEMARWVERRFSHAPQFARRTSLRIREFGQGLRTIHSVGHFFKLVLISFAIWLVIAAAYLQVVHAYGGKLQHMQISHVILLMGSAMIGSVVQLPAVGGGTQLATIGMLHYTFDVPPELAASCGVMIWLVTFMMVIPVGFLLAHREHISFREATRIVEEEEGTA